MSLYRQLAATSPDAFTPGLAMAVNNQAKILLSASPLEDALAPAQEAATLYRQLAATSPDAFTPASPRRRATRRRYCLSLRQQEDALAAAQEAVGLHRQLAAARPDALTPGLATALVDQAKILSELGSAGGCAGRGPGGGDALPAATWLARTPSPPASPRRWSTSAAILSELGRREDALAAAQEAVSLHRQLAATSPDAFTPGLAMAVNNQAKMLSDLGGPEDALAAAQEAVSLYRQLAATSPDAFTPGLARWQ